VRASVDQLAAPAGASPEAESVPAGSAASEPVRELVLSEEDRRIRDQLVAALEEHDGNLSAVARAMAKDRKQIQRWVKRFGLEPDRFRRPSVDR
jgi:transcriptional regulator with GAF, ATPase, and Fis domain